MSFLLKIVEGPNKGAEIALVSGVAVTLGKGDDCDIVLADSTLPDAPVSLEASDEGVTADGEPLEPFVVKTAGATSFAVGPSDAPWGELKWPEKGDSQKQKDESSDEGRGEDKKAADKDRKDDDAAPVSSPAPDESAAEPEDRKRRLGGCLGCLVAVALLIIVFVCLAWFYRAVIVDFCETKGYDLSRLPFGKTEGPTTVEKITLDSVAARYGLSVDDGEGTVKVTGNLKTRAERLRATAEAYAVRPGVELDLSDDESFRTAAEDALFTFTEGALKVVSATNRVLSVSGVSRSPEALRRTLRALNADLPKLCNVDASGVRFGVVPKHDPMDGGREDEPSASSDVARLVSKKKSTAPSLPVCGILTKPYPCLVMRDGSRVLEGAALGESVILKIEADAVTVTNSTGRFIWKP